MVSPFMTRIRPLDSNGVCEEKDFAVEACSKVTAVRSSYCYLFYCCSNQVKTTPPDIEAVVLIATVTT
jgi:hypothetical protein